MNARFARPLLALLVVSLTACGKDAAEIPDHDVQTIVSYEVPAGAEEEIESVVNSLLGVGEDGDRIGRARVLPNRMLVVSAPASVQSGIAEVIEDLGDAPQVAPHRIRLHYWLVRGIPAEESRVPTNLRAIDQALEDLQETAGKMQLERLDYVQHVLRSGARGQVQGSEVGGQARAASRHERIAIDLELSARSMGGHLQTQMDVNSGETIVLAQMGTPARAQDDVPADAVHLFVIRAEVF